MAVTFFEEQESNGEGELLFINDWMKKNPKTKSGLFTVNQIVKAKSGKGFLLRTEYFAIWLWKNSAVAKQLMEALDIWVNESPGTGHTIIVSIDPKAKDGYRLGADKELPFTWFASKNGYTAYQEDVVSQEGTNPFL